MAFESEGLNSAHFSPALGLVIVKLLLFLLLPKQTRAEQVATCFQSLSLSTFERFGLKFIIWRLILSQPAKVHQRASQRLAWPWFIDPSVKGLESLFGQIIPSSLQSGLQWRVWCAANWPLTLFTAPCLLIFYCPVMTKVDDRWINKKHR